MIGDKFNDRLNIVLFYRDMSASDLARAANLSPTTISRYCTGERTPTYKAFCAICECTKADPRFLMGLTDNLTFK